MFRRRFPLGLSGEPPPAWLGLLATARRGGGGHADRLPAEVAAPVVSLGVVYLPAILLISIVWGLRLGLLASVASASPSTSSTSRRCTASRSPTKRTGWRWLTFVIVAAISSTVAGLARAQALEAERRREQADRALAELAALSRERDRMQAEMVEAEALRRSDELKTALLRSISHDLRTPLTSIIAGGGGARLGDADRRASAPS